MNSHQIMFLFPFILVIAYPILILISKKISGDKFEYINNLKVVFIVLIITIVLSVFYYKYDYVFSSLFIFFIIIAKYLNMITKINYK